MIILILRLARFAQLRWLKIGGVRALTFDAI